MPTLRDFRKRVSVLKKQGLIPERTKRGTKIDARSADPRYKLKNGRTLGSLVTKFDDVTSGKATAVKLPPERLKQFKKHTRYKVVNDRLIVPHGANEKATVEKGELVITTKRGNISRIQIPIPFQNLHQYLHDIQKDKKRIDAMKRHNEWFGFRLYSNSSDVYANIELLVQHLETYSIMTEGPMKQQEVYENLEIVRIKNPSKNWTFPGSRRKLASKESNREKMRKFRANLKYRPQAIQQEYRDRAAERNRKYRARLRNSQLKTYKLKAKKRAAKSHKKRKAFRKAKRKK